MQALPTLALALLIFAPSALAAQQAERYTLEGDDIAIYNLAGALTVEPGTGSVTVELTRGGADAGRLQIERGELRRLGDPAGGLSLPGGGLRRARVGLLDEPEGAGGRHLRRRRPTTTTMTTGTGRGAAPCASLGIGETSAPTPT